MRIVFCGERLEDGGWRIGWRMKDGGWRMEDGGWRIDGWMEYLREDVK